MRIGPFTLDPPLLLAPMAGVTDLPFRRLCRRYGASLAATEMISSRPQLMAHWRTMQRTDHSGEPEPRVVQILGVDPQEMAACAQASERWGAQIIDINMGCPAKKVCKVAAGSALLRDEGKVAAILAAVVDAVSVPVTLKIRTGWDENQRNAVTIARIAEQAGIAALTIHGRTRACGFKGQAEYRTIAQVKQTVAIPVIANGDIDTPQKAREVIRETGADGVMIGRAAQGRPWIFRDIAGFLRSGKCPSPLGQDEINAVITDHIQEIHWFYGTVQGVRIARKHIGWYLKCLSMPEEMWKPLLREDEASVQLEGLRFCLRHLQRAA